MKKVNVASMVLAVLLLVSLLAGCAPPQAGQSAEMRHAGDGIIALAGLREGEKVLGRQDLLPAGNPLSDWVAMVFAFSGRKDDYNAYLKELETHVTAAYAENGKLDDYKATEWHRIALTALALGADPTSFGKDASGNAINLIADGTYNYAGDFSAQGTNGLIFALITLDAMNYDVPEESAHTRKSILADLLAAQSPNGGFGLTAGASDVDITAMALSALANYRGNPAVDKAVAFGVEYLSGQQTDFGDFASNGERNSESVSQAIIALCALGIDPATDERFVKNGNSLYDALLTYQNADGSFRHQQNDTAGDIMPTEQAMLALAAIGRFHETGQSIYDFTEYSAPGAGANQLIWILGAVLVVLVIAVALIYLKKRKCGGKTRA